MSNLKVAVYTTIFGRYDKLRAIPEQTIDADYWCICNERPDFDDNALEHWAIIQRSPHPIFEGNMRMNAKQYKFNPLDCPVLTQYDVLIYIDAKYQILRNDFVEFCLSQLNKTGFSVCLHPERNNIFDEAKRVLTLEKSQGQPVAEQVEFYKRQGFYKQVPLYELSLIVRTKNNLINNWQIGQEVIVECLRWSQRDQISFPYICWRHDFKPAAFLPDKLFRHQWDTEYWTTHWNPNK